MELTHTCKAGRSLSHGVVSTGGMNNLTGPYLHTRRVFGEVEEPLQWSFEDPPVGVSRAVGTSGDDALHHL